MNPLLYTAFFTYLSKHDEVCLQGVGCLQAWEKAARRENNQLKPPKRLFWFVFDQSCTDTDPRLLYYLREKSGLDAAEVENALLSTFNKASQELLGRNSFQIVQFGRFYKEADRIVFEPNHAAYIDKLSLGKESVLLRGQTIPVVAKPAVEDKKTDKPRIPTSWLKWAAAILILLSINIVVFTYLEHLNTVNTQSLSFSLDDTVMPANMSLKANDSLALEDSSQLNETGLTASTANLEEKPIVNQTIVDNPSSLAAYEIIVGAFRDETNALQLVAELKLRGYDAHLAGKTATGLFRVSAASFNQAEMAEAFLEQAKRVIQQEAWILSKLE